MENERLKVKAIAQGHQGDWTTWEGVAERNITLADLWKIPQTRLSFLVRATYDSPLECRMRVDMSRKPAPGYRAVVQQLQNGPPHGVNHPMGGRCGGYMGPG